MRSYSQKAKIIETKERNENESLEMYKKSCFYKEGEIYKILIKYISNFEEDPTYLNDYVNVYFICINNKGRLCFKPCLEHPFVYYTKPFESFIDILKK
jgi:hypothetical protein